jgi:[phosphatase 2A protein]-leucine-carboxy methyltransferase
MSGDEVVQSTNDDATNCKRSAVAMGYWNDPYLPFVARNPDRKPPEIHLGYYARVKGIQYLIEKFFEACDTKVQIINLGAGFDTLFWRLRDESRPLKNFIEVDFSGVTSRKCYYIKRHQELVSQVTDPEGEIKLSKTDLHGTDYHLVAADLSNLTNLEQKLIESEVDFSCPTLVLAECVLVYVNSSKTEAMAKWLADRFHAITFINYEQLNMTDRFGDVMMENLLSRGCLLSGVRPCKDKQSQLDRFNNNGWSSATCWNMNEVYSLLPQGDVQRVEKIECLDEKELLRQLFDHYCITVARKNAANFNFDSVNFD